MKKEVRFLLDFLTGKKTEITDYDWYYILGFIKCHNLSGMFYEEKMLHGLQIPKKVESIIANEYLLQKYRVEYMRKWLKDISYTLNSSDLKYVFLKGSILSHVKIENQKVYKDGERISNDIDVLIMPHDVTKITRLLSDLGFRQGYWDRNNNRFVPLSRKEIVNRRMNRGETAPFIVETYDYFVPYIEIDVNFSVDYLPTGSEEIVSSIIDSRKEYVLDETSKLFGPSAEWLFLHLILHQYKEGMLYSMVERGKEVDLYKFMDIFKLLSLNQVDLNIVRIIAKKINLLNTLEQVLGITDVLFLTKYSKKSYSEEKVIDMDNKKQFTWTVSLEKRISDFDRVKYLKEISNEENGIKQKSPFVMRGGLFFDMDKE